MVVDRRIRKRQVKKFYQVKHRVDDSVQYFEASYLLGDGPEDGSKTAGGGRTSDAASRRSMLLRSVSMRSAYGARESVLNSEDFDDVTNINRLMVFLACIDVTSQSKQMSLT